MQLADYRAALADYNEAFRFLPGGDNREARADLCLHRGWAYFFCEAWPLAVDDFDEAIRLCHTNGDAYSGRAYALVKLDDYRQGVRDAEEALRRGSRTPEVLWANVAYAYAQAVSKVRQEASGSELQAREGEYTGKAVASLRRALGCRKTPEERWILWRDQLLLDRGLDPIRETPAIKDLQAELKAAAARPNP
jgi:tetratricopeptide (TPR) repeat protein